MLQYNNNTTTSRNYFVVVLSIFLSDSKWLPNARSDNHFISSTCTVDHTEKKKKIFEQKKRG